MTKQLTEENFIPITNTRYRPNYHVAPTNGWMNDPNGFVYFQGYYHIFYQHYPYAAQWGPMHWGHKRSRDLMHWEDLPIALTPGDSEDTDGVFSGSAIVKDGRLWLVYTGHHYYGDNDPEHFWQNQNLAYSDDGIHFTKYANNPIISQAPDDSSHHFRDPKIWEHNGFYYIILGNQSNNGFGRAILYQSTDLFEWQYLGVLDQSQSIAAEGDMWECPDFFTLNGKEILLMSPMNIQPQAYQFKNLYQTGYFIGQFDYTTQKFERNHFQELDHGHDFYASQTMLSPDGRRIVIGWADMWESKFNEKSDGWTGLLTLPRQLILNDDHLSMQPVAETSSLRQEILCQGPLSPTTMLSQHNSAIEIKATLATSNVSLYVKDVLNNDIISLHFDKDTHTFVLNHIDHPNDPRYAFVNELDQLDFNIFVDHSVIEIFVQQGEAVFTERFYITGTPVISLVSDDNSTISGQFTTYRLDSQTI